MPLGRPEAWLGAVWFYMFVTPEFLMPPVLDYEKFLAIMEVGIFGAAGCVPFFSMLFKGF